MNVVARVHFKITDTTLNAELAETAEPMHLSEFCGLCVDRRQFCNMLLRREQAQSLLKRVKRCQLQ